MNNAYDYDYCEVNDCDFAPDEVFLVGDDCLTQRERLDIIREVLSAFNQ